MIARPLVPALYATLAYAFTAPLLREVQRVTPMNFGDPDWRFGAAGFFLAASLLPMLALAGAHLVASAQGQERTRRLLSWGTLLVSGVAFGLLVILILDYPRILPDVPEQALPVVRATTLTAGVSGFFSAAITAFLGIGGLRSASTRSTWSNG